MEHTLLQQNFTTEELYEDLQKSNVDLVRQLLELKDFSLVMLDASGHVTSWNAGAEHIYGYKAEEITGEHVSVFYRRKDVQEGQPGNNLALAASKGRHEFETIKRKKDGTEFYANTILTVLHHADKSIKGFAKVTRDVSIQKKLEKENKILKENLEMDVKERTKELLIVNAELEAFSYSVSHDLRVPLRAISGYSAMLKKDYQPILDGEANRIINVIVDKTKMMSQLIDDLLTFSRMARLEVVSDFIDMKKMAETCMNELLQIEKQTSYTISILDMPKCKGDGSMLKQVWYNLISNALKYSSKKQDAQIEAGTIDNEKMNIYYVKDNGAGFDMKYAKNLFGVFQRLHRQEEFEGTGLGLALAKRIISKHGGEIWAESALNNGSTFYFSIPKTI